MASRVHSALGRAIKEAGVLHASLYRESSRALFFFLYINIIFAVDLGTLAALQSGDTRQGGIDSLTESKRKILAFSLMV